MERLSKDQSRRRWAEVRGLWNEWDPIGVVSSEVQDEYDSYLGPTLRFLEEHASSQALVGYLTHIVGEYMGLGASGVQQSNPQEFANRLCSWYQSNWPNTSV